MIKSSPHPTNPDDSTPSALEPLIQARGLLNSVLESIDPLLEAMDESSLEDVRPKLSETMNSLLRGTRSIVEAAGVRPDALIEDIESSQKFLSDKLLYFRRAMGSGSTDTIQESLRLDLATITEKWIQLAEILIDDLKTLTEDA